MTLTSLLRLLSKVIGIKCKGGTIITDTIHIYILRNYIVLLLLYYNSNNIVDYLCILCLYKLIMSTCLV